MNAGERLFGLLPAVHRARDADVGDPLRALLEVVGEQVDVLTEDLLQLYDNWFVETCEEWLLPYLGDLVGYRAAFVGGEPGDPGRPADAARNRILFPRRDVAATVGFRRRRGSAAQLPREASAASGWPVRVVEMHALVAAQLSLVHPRVTRGGLLDLRGTTPDDVDGPFATAARLADTRRLTAASSLGRHAPSAVAVYAWRLRARRVTRRQAYAQEGAGPHCFTFSALGVDTQLFVRPPDPHRPSDAGGPVTDPLQVPVPLTRRLLHRRLPDLYGPDRSLHLWWVPPEPPSGRGGPAGALPAPVPIPVDRIIVTDLSDWAYRPPRDHVAVDPQLGRIAFPPAASQLPRRLWVGYSHAGPADLGGGEYPRDLPAPAEDTVVYRIGGGARWRRIGQALAAWRQDAPRRAVIEIMDSAVYVEPVEIGLGEGQSLWLRAGAGCAPVLRLLDWQTDGPDALAVGGGAGSCFVLDGLLVSGRGLRVWGALARLALRHCTLVPGWSLDPDCDPRRPAEASLELLDVDAHVSIDSCVLGSIRVVHDEVLREPVPVSVCDSVIDSTGPAHAAVLAPGDRSAHVRLRLARSTVIGRVLVHALELAENALFAGPLQVARPEGRVRFCYVPPGSRTPRRTGCQPDQALRAIDESYDRGDLTAAQRDVAARLVPQRVRPLFESVRYGTPGYVRLDPACVPELRTGADDRGELGVHHDLFDPQRAANLAARLQESTPAGVDAAAVLVT